MIRINPLHIKNCCAPRTWMWSTSSVVVGPSWKDSARDPAFKSGMSDFKTVGIEMVYFEISILVTSTWASRVFPLTPPHAKTQRDVVGQGLNESEL